MIAPDTMQILMETIGGTEAQIIPSQNTVMLHLTIPICRFV